ncbi:MAG: adenylyl-sulfate kinase [Wenzhouxiangellaceae bacterium]|nr:adenylyl-sulfate kinase [Wenzhouxiangellaceae bacterium]
MLTDALQSTQVTAVSCPDRALAEALAWQPRGGRGRLLWITGLSGVGKTTLSASIHARLSALQAPVAWLDGDAMRRHFAVSGERLEAATRLQLAMRYASMAAGLARAGAWVVVSTISLFHCIHAINRRRALDHDIGYVEVLLRAQEEMRERHASDRFGGPRVGHELPAQMPVAPHLILDNDYSPATLRRLTDRVIRSFG